jgi:hypothetical protein
MLVKTLIELGQTFNDFDFYFWEASYPMHFKNPLSFMRYLKALGAAPDSQCLSHESISKIIGCRHLPLNMEYKVFFGIFQKK